jgi:hypothetical protein
MTPYLDAGFVITLLINTSASRHAREVIRPFQAPFILNSLHHLQLENFLSRARLEGTKAERLAGAASERLWRQYLAEGVVQISDVDWKAAIQRPCHHLCFCCIRLWQSQGEQRISSVSIRARDTLPRQQDYWFCRVSCN